ncbi:MAG: thioredoxin family protein [Anaerolineae bacterium]|nr:thioredoxin family protein [Anaerolineae bacterium]
MIERLLIITVVAVIAVFVYQMYTRRQLAFVTANRNIDPLLRGLNPNIPAIVYFTTPNCIPCKVQQQPALDKLKTDLGENIQIIQVDATQEPEVADRWGVLSAPTTFVLNTDGQAKAVNHGVADVHKLKRQIQVMKPVS